MTVRTGSGEVRTGCEERSMRKQGQQGSPGWSGAAERWGKRTGCCPMMEGGSGSCFLRCPCPRKSHFSCYLDLVLPLRGESERGPVVHTEQVISLGWTGVQSTEVPRLEAEDETLQKARAQRSFLTSA